MPKPRRVMAPRGKRSPKRSALHPAVNAGAALVYSTRVLDAYERVTAA